MEGVILQGIGSFYTILCDGQNYVCRPQKKLRKFGKPLPGDLVSFTPGAGEEDGWIEEIHPRKNALIRPAVANVDALALVIAPVPQPDLLLIERMILCAMSAGIEPMLIVNKTDLDATLGQRMREEYTGTALQVFETSARKGEGLSRLREALSGKLTCFAGQSAVGKSSLLNALFHLELETGDISRKTEHGRHTTRRSELLSFEDTRFIDTPGFSLLDAMEINPEDVPGLYPEYVKYSHNCRFQPCYHDREPGCAVRAQVESGNLNAVRYERYRTLLAEIRELWKERYR